MRRDQESFNPKNRPQKMEGNQISPYDVIRLKNCKLFQFRRNEMYPSVRPPVSQCDPEETAAFLSASMEANGLGSFDPRIGVSSLDRSNEMGIVRPCRTRKMQEPLYKSGRSPHMVLDWSKMTPYDLMRLQNCKTFDFQKCERYPNVRPPVSPCNAEWTAQWLANAVENCGCQRLFDMEIDDILDIWKRSPAKESLGFYGVDSGIATPEAIEYNQLVSRCLDKVSRRKRGEKEVKKPLAKSEEKTGTPGILLLNRSKLESRITKMPTVQKKLHPSTALSCIHCPRRTTSKPFLEAPRSAPDMEKPVRKSKRKQQFCDLQFEVPDWRKYKEVSVSSEAVFQKELAKEFENEPKNYDELYSQLIACFEKDLLRDRLDAAYYKCCKQFCKSGGAHRSGKGAKGGGGRHGDGEGDGRGTGDGNEVGDGDNEGAEYKEMEESKGVGFGGTEGQGEGAGEGGGEGGGGEGTLSYGLGDGGQGAAVAKKDKAAAETGIGATGSGDGKIRNKKPGDKADKAAGKVGKKTAGKAAKDQAKKPANSQEPKDPVKKQIKLFELPNALESVTEGESNLSEQKSITKLQNDDDEVKDSSLASFWKRPSREELGRKRKGKVGKVGKVGKRRESKAKGRARKKAEQRFSTDSTATKTKDQDCPCPCEICELMNRRERDPPDPPYILEMLKEQRYRQIIEYHRRLCHGAYLLRNCPQYPAPAHRCDPIECDEPASFSLDPKIAEYFDRLTAIDDLQKLLCAKKHSQVDHQLLFLVQNLKDRLCWRLNQLL
ncbi:hypothetical protein ACLKA7_004732 [Drosophila subpalustris]